MRQGHPNCSGTKDKQKLIKKFHFQSDLELCLPSKNHFPEARKNFDFIFENFAKFCAKAIFFIVFGEEISEIWRIRRLGGEYTPPSYAGVCPGALSGTLKIEPQTRRIRKLNCIK